VLAILIRENIGTVGEDLPRKSKKKGLEKSMRINIKTMRKTSQAGGGRSSGKRDGGGALRDLSKVIKGPPKVTGKKEN